MAQNRFHQGPGPSQRQLRVGELIRRTLSDVLLRGDVHDPDLNRHSITVGEVRTSPDLKVATVYVMPLGGHAAEDALAALRRNTRELRHHVARDMTLKYAPDLRFVLDETFDRMDDTRRMFADERVRRDVEEGDAPGDDPDGAVGAGGDEPEWDESDWDEGAELARAAGGEGADPADDR